MFGSAKKFLMRVAEKILDVDETVEPATHIRFLEDYSSRMVFDTKAGDIAEFLRLLRKKHLVDEIVVSTLNGSAIASTNGNPVAQAITGAALFNYVKSEMPKSETVIVKSNGWHMLFVFNRKLYMVKAAADLSNIELKALAKEIDLFLSNKGLN